MPKEHILVNDIIADHRERMLNLKKYYPFFKLSEVSFSWFKDGIYDNLDMGYILMAVLRFFIEENNFKERDVTYNMYYQFMTEFIRSDLRIALNEQDNKQLVDFIFDKLKNDGRPFSFEYYDPVDRAKKVSRVKLLESRIQDNVVWYSISSDGIEFYLDTKEIRDESKISVEQLLLEKMIESKDFRGGTEVVKRINNEVELLKYHKNKVLELLTVDVFAGVEAYERFFDTGIKWFDEEQKLFIKNRELIESALNRARDEKVSGDTTQFYQTTAEIYRLDTELKVAMNNHSELLRACTDLGIKTDEAVKKAKLSRLRSRFDFKSALETMINNNRPDALEYVIKPFLGMNFQKTFDLAKLEDMLSYRPEVREKAEKIHKDDLQDIVFEDELAQERFNNNAATLLLILFEMVDREAEFTLAQYNDRIVSIFSDRIFQNGDYYAFLVHLCQKKDYFINDKEIGQDTFLDEIIKDCMKEKAFEKYIGLHFVLKLSEGIEEELLLTEQCQITNFVVRRV